MNKNLNLLQEEALAYDNLALYYQLKAERKRQAFLELLQSSETPAIGTAAVPIAGVAEAALALLDGAEFTSKELRAAMRKVAPELSHRISREASNAVVVLLRRGRITSAGRGLFRVVK